MEYVNLELTVLCGSKRRQDSNSKFLATKAAESGQDYINEINNMLEKNESKKRVTLSTDIFETDISDKEEMIQSVAQANALLVSTPVYFGSLSPSLNETLSSIASLDLTEKTIGSITVGTQRNGGQETTNQDLWRYFFDRQITFTGTGPVISHYGGAGWAGAPGEAKDDNYGISTSKGAGKTLVQSALLRKVGAEPIPCSYLIFSSGAIPSDDALALAQGLGDSVGFLALDRDYKEINDCVACPVCPPNNARIPSKYMCIYDDDVNKNYPYFYGADAIICDVTEQYGLTPSRYWRVMNRFRAVRRNNYDLSGKMGSVVGGSLIPLKWLMRNNVTMLASSRSDFKSFGKLLSRETGLRKAGQRWFAQEAVNPWTPPMHHM